MLMQTHKWANIFFINLSISRRLMANLSPMCLELRVQGSRAMRCKPQMFLAWAHPTLWQTQSRQLGPAIPLPSLRLKIWAALWPTVMHLLLGAVATVSCQRTGCWLGAYSISSQSLQCCGPEHGRLGYMVSGAHLFLGLPSLSAHRTLQACTVHQSCGSGLSSFVISGNLSRHQSSPVGGKAKGEQLLMTQTRG